MNEKYKFDINEIKALYRILEHEWINRDDEEAQEVVDKIHRIVEQHERLAGKSSSTA